MSLHDTGSIAIVAAAGRFPGARTVDELWQNLCAGVESIRRYTPEELDAFGVDPAVRAHPKFVPAGALLDDVDRFDAALFGFNRRDAEVLDPQHRLFFECVWEALERAGYAPGLIREPVGIFAGTSLSTYLLYNLIPDGQAIRDVGLPQTYIANDKDSLTTHVAYKLNLRGPSVTVQTACSTSLVAVQLACQSLLTVQCDVAVAGGVSVQVPHQPGYVYQDGGIASPDGRCRAFDASAAGTVSGNGVGTVVLKRFEDAIADRDTILAVIRGAAINNDGAGKIGYTAPGADGQAEVIALAHGIAGVTPDSIGYIEAHGTGTPLGDPVEIAALTRVFSAQTPRRQFCAIGSVKTNIGHLDAAAGVAGLIKAALAVHHGVVPPSLYFERPNANAALADGPFFVPTRAIAWPLTDGPRRAGVSSFGIGGTNAHVVLEQAPEPAASERPARNVQLIALSARSADSADRLVAETASHLADHPGIALADAAFTLQIGRRAWPHRRLVAAATTAEAIEALRSGDARVRRAEAPARAPSVAFLFSGQGTQAAGMARDLYESEPRFRAELDRCCDELRPHLDIDLRSLLLRADTQVGPYNHPDVGADPRVRPDDPSVADRRVRPRNPLDVGADPRARPDDPSVVGADLRVRPDPLTDTALAQPALFAFEYALARLWESWGVKADAMIGHSLGEYVAACLAGVLSRTEALRLIAARGRLMQALPPGAMLAVPLSESELAPMLGTRVSLAAINGPRSTVASGPIDAIDALAAALDARGLVHRRLDTSHAFHSAMMEPMLAPFRRELEAITLSPPSRPYVSNLTGTWITPAEATDPAYWLRHLREPVRFADGIATLLGDDSRVALEVGRGQTLSNLSSAVVRNRVRNRIRNPQSAIRNSSVTEAVADLWLHGVAVDWTAYHDGERRRRVPMPVTPFERQRYWIDPPSAAAASRAAVPAPNIDGWLYVPAWSAAPLRVAADARQVIVVSREQATIDRLVARLSRDGHIVSGVRPEELAALASGMKSEPALTVCLADTVRDLDDPLAMARALAGVASATLLFVEDDDPRSAVVTGPALVIPQEYPNLRCRLVVVDSSVDRIDALAAEIGGTEPLVALRDGARMTRRFVYASAVSGSSRTSTSGSHRLERGGVYWITGATGGIGRALAEHLARTYGARLILTARTEIAQDTIAALETAGAGVLARAADVTDAAAMRAVADAAIDRFGRIDGVIHAAGIPGGGMIALAAAGAAGPVLAPKVDGTLLLADIARQRSVRFLALCSSLASVQGGFGQADYVAANAFLDAFAERHTRDSGIFTVSIGWDAWRETGMAVAVAAALQARTGTAATAPVTLPNGLLTRDAIAIFERVLAGDASHVAVSTTDLDARIASLRDGTRTVTAIAGNGSRAAAGNVSIDTDLAAVWRGVLGDDAGAHDNFFDVGGDSLKGVQLVARINERFGLEIPVARFFGAPTLASLAALIRESSPQAAVPIAGVDPALDPSRERGRLRHERRRGRMPS